MNRPTDSRWHAAAEAVLLPTGAIAAALLLFGVFVWFGGTSPVEAWTLLFKGAFGDWFSWQNSLQRAAPLMLTALCVAIPARAGLIVIGGEGALVLDGSGKECVNLECKQVACEGTKTTAITGSPRPLASRATSTTTPSSRTSSSVTPVRP